MEGNVNLFSKKQTLVCVQFLSCVYLSLCDQRSKSVIVIMYNSEELLICFKDIFKCLQILLFLFSQDESYTPTPNEPLLVVVPPQGNQRILAFNLNILLCTVLAKK
jgi:hypothetical protein